jgi:hypothetical protein
MAFADPIWEEVYWRAGEGRAVELHLNTGRRARGRRVARFLYWRPAVALQGPPAAQLSCFTVQEEAAAVARSVRARLEAGAPPESIAVAVRQLARAHRHRPRRPLPRRPSHRAHRRGWRGPRARRARRLSLRPATPAARIGVAVRRRVRSIDSGRRDRHRVGALVPVFASTSPWCSAVPRRGESCGLVEPRIEPKSSASLRRRLHGAHRPGGDGCTWAEHGTTDKPASGTTVTEAELRVVAPGGYDKVHAGMPDPPMSGDLPDDHIDGWVGSLDVA